MKKNQKRYDDAIHQLAQYLSLSDDAIAIAEGWSLLPKTVQRHVKLLIDDHIAQSIPQLKQYYEGVSKEDQLRFNRVIERVQQDLQNRPPENN